MESQALELFVDRLPRKPYCTDDLDCGLVIRARQIALEKAYLQHSPPAYAQALIYDIDRPLAELAHVHADVAKPNFYVVNPINGHGHAIYVLETPVVRTAKAHDKPLAYAAAIETAYRSQLSADIGYTGLVCKNPLVERWTTIHLRGLPYALDELREWVTLDERAMTFSRIREDVAGLGRNCALFENLRVWAYSEIRKYWKPVDESGFRMAVLTMATRLNTFCPPLPYGELKQVSNSIAKWTWKRFSADRFRAIQRSRSAKASIKRIDLAFKRAEMARELRDQGNTQAAIAEIMGLHRSTVYRLLNCRSL